MYGQSKNWVDSVAVWTLGKAACFSRMVLSSAAKASDLVPFERNTRERRPDVLSLLFCLNKCSTLAQFRAEIREWA